MLRRRDFGFVIVGCLCLVQFATGDLVKAVIRNAFTAKGKDFNDIPCPDKKSHCQSNYTCCKATGEIYGCCDLPKAVCCTDGKSCCPEGYKCDLEHRKCYPKPDGSPVPIRTVTTQQNKASCCGNGTDCCPSGSKCNLVSGTCDPDGEVIPMKSIAPTQDIYCPDGTSTCPEGTTCCELADGQGWGCCPYPNAVCCKDGEHCCPQGYACDISAGTCTKQQEVIILKALNKFPAKVSDVTCPDGQSQCPTGTTCCKLTTGQYGCCPYPDAVCCNDGEHCCPQGYMCDLSAGTCSKKGEMLLKASEKFAARVSDITCPDGQSQCPTGTTCCKLTTGQYGCCPYPDAVCCNDGEHCCPQGYTCDLSAGTCSKKGEMLLKAFEKFAARVSDVTCPDGQSQCPTGTTCCKLTTGQYGCCPYPDAVCCNDGQHCCPQGYTCDLSAGTCSKKGEMLLKVSEMFTAIVSNFTCPDGRSLCPTGSTCCIQSSGQYGCCPFSDAVCCNDGVHCCPQGYTCDVSAGTCSKKGEMLLKAFEKFAARVSDVTCPDGQSQCPTGTTCCKLTTGQYGCCPYPDAVCCNDGEHCCPQGYTCDLSAGTCSKKGEMLLKASEMFTAKVSVVICPDGRSQCPTGSTCCIQSSGQYGCCPYPDAVCCNDGVHCCPQGYTCDLSAGTCSKKGEILLKAFEKFAARVSDVTCPDGQSQCPTGTTCCKLTTGQYGCCPYPDAVCCNDGQHCCPQGYTCDLSAGTCSNKGEMILKASEKFAAKVSDVLCPDGSSSCPTGTTCCKLAGEQAYGCCPFVQAVCCSDGLHCCPQGYTCDLSSGTCTKKGAMMMIALEKQTAKVANVICPDGKSSCPTGTTCCGLPTGDYGCCPFPNAVCCNDKVHCCPQGYTCDVAQGSCTKKGKISVKAVKNLSAKVPNLVCPDGTSSCPTGTTCCKLSSGGYGCCAFPNAVCCSDGEHCCPEGYTCDVAQGTCTKKGELPVKALEKFPAKESAWNIICPGARKSCSDGQTCCHSKDGSWNCCPHPDAVCCTDGMHCCPHGHVCSRGGGCSRLGKVAIRAALSKDTISEFLTLKPSKTNIEVIMQNLFGKGDGENSVMCPDDSECPNFNTCCQVADGKYGCCGFAAGVCCSDHTHCCKHGFVCDSEHTLCIQKGQQEPMTKMRFTGRDEFVVKSSQSFDEM